MGRMRGTPEWPEGLVYLPDFIDAAQEADLLSRLRDLEYGEVRMHGQAARRVVRHWGVGYDFDTRELTPGEAIPGWLAGARAGAAGLLGVEVDEVAEALATYDAPGATIGWHRDAPAFGNVVGISLGSSCLMRFQRGKGDDRRVHEQALEPRSGYLLAGAVRTRWEHSIPAVTEPRWSLTFRTVRRRWTPRAA